MGVLAIVVGFGIVGWMVLDSFQALLATGIRSGPWSFSRRYYEVIWHLYRPICARMTDDARRERWLSRLGPLTFMGLLLSWAVLEILGWGLVWWGFRNRFVVPLHGVSVAWYFSGIVYFSIGFGDVLPATGGIRLLTVLEGFNGLGTIGLVIGYLPSLYAAYSARERQLLLLDDLTDGRITPITLVRSQLGTNQDLSALDAMFDSWSEWCADVYDSHTSLPNLIWFRSKHRGHSWITGLGVVTDAAVAFIATVPGADQGSAMRLYRQSVRLVTGLSRRIGLEPQPDETLPARWWSVGYTAMQTTGLPLRSFEDSYARLCTLRQDFHPYMEAFIEELLAPHGFWGVTAADHLAEADFSTLFSRSDPDEDGA